MNSKKDSPKKESPYKYLTIISQLAISTIIPIVLMIFVGKALNYFFNTGPIVMIICILLGVIAGLRELYDIPMKMNMKSMAYNKREQEEYEKEKAVEENKKDSENENEND
jgi:F0F1-type ATP synthase assembly protein I